MIDTFQLRRFADKFDANTVFKVTSSINLHPYGSTSFNFFKRDIVDFIQIQTYKIVSLVTGNIYSSAVTFDSVSLSYDQDQKKAIIKTKQMLEYDIEYFLVRALNVMPVDIFTKNQSILLNYKKKLLKFIKSKIVSNDNIFTQKQYDSIVNTTDYSFLLQYFPGNLSIHNKNYKHYTKVKYFQIIREKLYNLFFSDKTPFRQMCDEDLCWMQSCVNLFQPLKSSTHEIFYTDLHVTEKQNFELVNRARILWHELIVDARKTALKHLAEESIYPTNLNDENILREIEAIKRHINETANDKIIMEELGRRYTIIDILRFWPTILAPAPSQYCSF